MNSCRIELARLQAKIAELQTLSGIDLDIPPCQNLELLVKRPRVGVGCILLSPQHEAKLLIGERQGSHGAGKWALPGGHLEQNESWQECAEKEVLEECGIRIRTTRWEMLHVSNDPMPEEDRHYVTIFMYAFLVSKEDEGIVNLESEKCKGWEWVRLEDVQDKPTFAPLQHFIETGGLIKLEQLQKQKQNTKP